MSIDPFRGAMRVSAPVVYRTLSNRGCIPGVVVGLALGGGFIGLGYSLGWMNIDYVGTVIGGGCIIALLSALGVAIVINQTAKPKTGTLVLEGGRLSGPDQSTVWDLNQPHDIVIRADNHQAALKLTIPGTGFADGAPDEIGRQLALQAGPGLSLHLIGVPAAQLVDCFELPAYVEPLDPAEAAGGITLDRNDPRQQPLLDPLLAAIGHGRAQNTRYQTFAALPWQQPPAPASPPLRDISLEPGVDPRAVFTALSQSPAGADPANPRAVVARAYFDTRLWIHQKVGVTPDYLLVDGAGGLQGGREHSFTLIPIGGGRSSMRRDMHRVTTTSTASVGSTTYPALVIEGPSLGAPIWVVFDQPWSNMDNELDAAVAFVNRG